VTPGLRRRTPFIYVPPVVRDFIRNTFSGRKLHQLCVNTALGNFVGFVAGSLVMTLTTYETIERRGLRNLFGVLPRKTIVVHRLPEWVEWSLCVLVGYIVMEVVRYLINSNKYLRMVGGAAHEKTADDKQPTTAT
jgi:hypothetical protein